VHKSLKVSSVATVDAASTAPKKGPYTTCILYVGYKTASRNTLLLIHKLAPLTWTIWRNMRGHAFLVSFAEANIAVVLQAWHAQTLSVDARSS
jgi:hypothetical protein